MKSEWCGTPNGYHIHWLRKEDACEECTAALRNSRRWWRFRTGSSNDPFRCKSCGSVFDEVHTCHAPSDLDSAKT